MSSIIDHHLHICTLILRVVSIYITFTIDGLLSLFDLGLNRDLLLRDKHLVFQCLFIKINDPFNPDSFTDFGHDLTDDNAAQARPRHNFGSIELFPTSAIKEVLLHLLVVLRFHAEEQERILSYRVGVRNAVRLLVRRGIRDEGVVHFPKREISLLGVFGVLGKKLRGVEEARSPNPGKDVVLRLEAAVPSVDLESEETHDLFGRLGKEESGQFLVMWFGIVCLYRF